MADYTNLPLTPLIVQAVGTPEKNVYPIPSDGKLTLRNDHKQYAITWFLLALVSVVMFAAYHRLPENKA
jgi:cytochrome oxidase assembly protein ShyY1